MPTRSSTALCSRRRAWNNWRFGGSFYVAAGWSAVRQRCRGRNWASQRRSGVRQPVSSFEQYDAVSQYRNLRWINSRIRQLGAGDTIVLRQHEASTACCFASATVRAMIVDSSASSCAHVTRFRPRRQATAGRAPATSTRCRPLVSVKTRSRRPAPTTSRTHTAGTQGRASAGGCRRDDAGYWRRSASRVRALSQVARRQKTHEPSDLPRYLPPRPLDYYLDA